MSYLASRRPGAAHQAEALTAPDLTVRDRALALSRAEQATADALAALGPAWRVLHSLPVGPGGAALPHLVIGPGGVLAVVSAPTGPTVVDAAGGSPRLSTPAVDDAAAQAVVLARRVHEGLVRRLGPGEDVPAVAALVCSTGGRPLGAGPMAGPGAGAGAVEVQRLAAHVLARPLRVPAAQADRLAAAAADPRTWGAPPEEWLPVGAPDAVAGTSAGPEAGSRPAPDRVLAGRVVAAGPVRLPARGPAVRAASVTMIALGVASLGTGGLLSPPSLVYGRVFLRRHGGLAWIDDRDGALFLVGMVLAALPLLFWLLVLPLVLGSVA